MEEIEVKFLDIDHAEIEAKLVKLGAVKIYSRTFRVTTFDYSDLRLNAEAAWVRLRDEGDQITLAFKQRQGAAKDSMITNDTTMLEHEVIVNSFATTAAILKSIGLTEKFVEEKRRTRYMLDDVEFDLDEMPLIPPYLEIEAKSWEAIDDAIIRLGLVLEDKRIFSAFQIYEVAGINMLDYKVLRFDDQLRREV